jgi:pSer/pThr/pTyr-binding forkhead associated (FHA) protein
MGVLQRFERRLGGLVEGAFAKVFKGGVEPVEIASALARETDDRRAVSSNRVLVPNEFAVELASGDFARLSPYDRALCDELAEMVREHAAEQRYTFVGPVSVRMSEAADLDVGVFRIRSSVAAADPGVVSGRRGRPRPSAPGTPHLLITTKAPGGTGGGGEREYPLDAETTVIGRSVECDIRLNDTGVSRRHGEIRRLPDGQFLYVDAGSTNGSLVNGRAATQVKLVSGDRIELGTATIVFRREDGRGSTAGRSPSRATPPPERVGHRTTAPPDRRPTPPPDDPYRRGSTPRGGQPYPTDPHRERPARAGSDPGYRGRGPDQGSDVGRPHDQARPVRREPAPRAPGRDAGPERAVPERVVPERVVPERGGRDPYRRDPRDRRDDGPRRPAPYREDAADRRREPARPAPGAAGPDSGLEPLDDVYDAQTYLPGQVDPPAGGGGGRGRSRSDRGW